MKNNVTTCGLIMSTLLSLSALAGTMGDVQTYPSGFLIGGDIGFGYLSTQESNIANPIPTTSGYIPNPLDITPGYPIQNHRVGSLIGGGYLGYEQPFLERLLGGIEIGYKYLGSSVYRDTDRWAWTDFGTHHSLAGNDTAAVYEQVNVEQQAIDLLVTGRAYLWDGFNLFAKGGAAYVYSNTKQRFNVSYDHSTRASTVPGDAYLNTNATIWRIKPELAIGAGYLFYKNFDFHLTYTFIGGTDGNNNGVNTYYADEYAAQTPGTFQYNALTAGLTYHFS